MVYYNSPRTLLVLYTRTLHYSPRTLLVLSSYSTRTFPTLLSSYSILVLSSYLLVLYITLLVLSSYLLVLYITLLVLYIILSSYSTRTLLVSPRTLHYSPRTLLVLSSYLLVLYITLLVLYITLLVLYSYSPHTVYSTLLVLTRMLIRFKVSLYQSKNM